MAILVLGMPLSWFLLTWVRWIPRMAASCLNHCVEPHEFIINCPQIIHNFIWSEEKLLINSRLIHVAKRSVYFRRTHVNIVFRWFVTILFGDLWDWCWNYNCCVKETKTAKQQAGNNRHDYVIFVLVHGVVNIPMKCGIISVYFRTFAVYYSILTWFRWKQAACYKKKLMRH